MESCFPIPGRNRLACSQRIRPPFAAGLAFPLIASHQTLGLLSLGHAVPGSFTPEHLRLAKSLAIPAAGPPLRMRPSLRS
jgi:GAF domain-containing protein